jgi:hypothetical protein
MSSGEGTVRDEQWPVARLIPISSASGVEAQERRLASALLAVMYAVPEFARALLKPLGAPAGRVDAFIEVPFRFKDRTTSCPLPDPSLPKETSSRVSTYDVRQLSSIQGRLG